MPRKKKKKIDVDPNGERWFGENSTARDNADGVVSCIKTILDELVKKDDRVLIAKMLEFAMVNYYEYIDMPEEEALEMKKLNPFVPLIRPPWQEPRNQDKSIKDYCLIDKGHAIRNMIDVIVADVVLLSNQIGEDAAQDIFRKLAGYIYEPYSIARSHQSQREDKQEEVDNLDKLWDMSNENNS